MESIGLRLGCIASGTEAVSALFQAVARLPQARAARYYPPPPHDRTAITVACLPDDIEQFLCVGQYARAIEALARRRNITADEARKRIAVRLLEIAALESGIAKTPDCSAGLLRRLKRKFVNGPVLKPAAQWGK